MRFGGGGGVPVQRYSGGNWQGGGYGGGYRRHHRHHGGFIPGVVIGGAFANSYGYYAPGYYDDYYDDSVVAVAPGGEDAEAYCRRTYRSYDPRSGTYLGYDGQRHPCP
jgi:BA14K-like protein